MQNDAISSPPVSSANRLELVVAGLNAGFARTAAVAAPPVIRIALAVPFFRSGLTRWDGFLSLSPSTTFLFEEIFKLHIFGGEYVFPAPVVMAHMVGMAEIILPIFLVFGFATRFTAFGLLIMTGVIQLVVPDGWANFHLPWAGLALAIIAIGPGALSLDGIMARVWARRSRR